MKRPFGPSKDYHAKADDVRTDFSADQLAAIGALAMNYNELESELFALFNLSTGMDAKLQLEVFTRVNGTEGIIEIIKAGAAIVGLSNEDRTELADALGEGGFKLIKRYRDAVIHSRIYNAPLGVGIRADKRASLVEVLLTKDALEILSEYAVALRSQLREAALIFAAARELKKLGPDDPEREPHDALAKHLSAQFLAHRHMRQSLRPLPEFPSEPELRQALDTWLLERQAAQMGWYQQLSQPPKREGLPEAVKSASGGQAPPHPLREDQK
jgi:hypothetical protein